MGEAVSVVTIDEVKHYLGIDYEDAMTTANIARAIKTADAYLKGAIGENYPTDDARAKELALIVVSDLYDNRGLNSTVSGNVRKLVEDLCLQLRVELARVAE